MIGRHDGAMRATRFAMAIALLVPFGLAAAGPGGARAAQPAAATRQPDLAAIAAYLNHLTTLKARFTQLAPDGALTDGTAWLWRPGRMRFQYDKPSPLLLVAGGGKLIFRDNSLDQTSVIPIDNSPLGILLAPHVALDAAGGVVVLGLNREPGLVRLRLARLGQESQGSLALTFTTDPLALKSWRVTDAQGNQTKVTLEDCDTGAGSFDPGLFVYHDPNLPQR